MRRRRAPFVSPGPGVLTSLPPHLASPGGETPAAEKIWVFFDLKSVVVFFPMFQVKVEIHLSLLDPRLQFFWVQAPKKNVPKYRSLFKIRSFLYWREFGRVFMPRCSAPQPLGSPLNQPCNSYFQENFIANYKELWHCAMQRQDMQSNLTVAVSTDCFCFSTFCIVLKIEIVMGNWFSAILRLRSHFLHGDSHDG